MNHVHLHIRRWVLWWFGLGVLFGAIALVNILFRDLTRSQERIILIVGILQWVLGGVVCWAFDGIKVQSAPPPQREQSHGTQTREWHSASEFIQPGGRRSLLPPWY